MTKLSAAAGWLASGMLPSTAEYANGNPPPLVLTGAKILDPADGVIREGLQVVIEGERIVEVAPAPRVSEAIRLDLTGLTLLPGLIDLHSHLLLHPYNEAPWEDQVFKESLELRTVRAVAAAKATLEAGFTTLRDLGTEGAGFADVALRDAIAKGIVPGPRIFATTRAIVATGCYGPSGFDPRWEVPKGAQEATGVDAVRRAVREQIAAGADWIKVYADYRRRNGEPPTPTFSQDELNALVDEAKTAGLPVAAHAFTDEAIRRAVLAGVATIEHGFNASEEVLGLMRERGVVLCPTLTAAESVARYGGWKPGTPDDPRVKEAKEMFARALRSGVTIACGSDVGVFAHGENSR
ncbi:MAG: metal-dependent hydrolase family protein, partial [Candidatus Binataceae bacterium]